MRGFVYEARRNIRCKRILEIYERSYNILCESSKAKHAKKLSERRKANKAEQSNSGSLCG